MRRQAVAPGPAGFLVIMLNALRHCRVDDKTDVRTVNPHPESNRSHNDIHFLPDKLLLVLMARFISQPGVIGKVFKPQGVQPPGDIINIIPAQAIDNPGFPGMFLQDPGYLRDNLRTHLNPISQIGPVNRGNINQGII